MKNLLRLTLIFLLSLSLLSCGKDSTPASGIGQPAEDGSENNVKPDGSKYVAVELASTEPDWSNIKVGETITLKFKVVAPFDESKWQFSKMFVNQKVDKGSINEIVKADITVSPVAASASIFEPSDLRRTEEKTISSIISDKSTKDPVYMQVTIKPNYALSTTITITTAIIEDNTYIHKGKVFTYNFTPKQ